MISNGDIARAFTGLTSSLDHVHVVLAAHPSECQIEEAGSLFECDDYDIDFDERNGAAGGNLSWGAYSVVISVAVASLFCGRLSVCRVDAFFVVGGFSALICGSDCVRRNGGRCFRVAALNGARIEYFLVGSASL